MSIKYNVFRNRLSFCFCRDQPIYFIKKGIFGSKSFRRKISDHFVEIYGAFVFLRKPFGHKDIRPFCSVFLSRNYQTDVQKSFCHEEKYSGRKKSDHFAAIHSAFATKKKPSVINKSDQFSVLWAIYIKNAFWRK